MCVRQGTISPIMNESLIHGSGFKVFSRHEWHVDSVREDLPKLPPYRLCSLYSNEHYELNKWYDAVMVNSEHGFDSTAGKYIQYLPAFHIYMDLCEKQFEGYHECHSEFEVKRIMYVLALVEYEKATHIGESLWEHGRIIMAKSMCIRRILAFM